MAGRHMRARRPLGTHAPGRAHGGGLARSFAVCLLVAVAVVVLACLVQCPKYATPDDFIQDLYVRGAYYSTPSWLMPYSMVFFSAPVSLLYRIAPTLPWFPLTLFAIVAVSFACVMHRAARARGRLARATLLSCLIACEAMVCLYFSYTVVAYVGVAGAMVVILDHAAFGRPDGLRPADIGALALLFLSFSLRVESDVSASSLFAPFLVWAIARNRNARTMGMAGLVVTLMLVSFVGGNLAWGLAPGWGDFARMFSAARHIADYPEVSERAASLAVPSLSRNDVRMIYEFLFADTSTFDYDALTSLGTAVEGYGVSTLVGAVLVRKSFSAFVLATLVLACAATALVCRWRRLRGAPRALAWSIPAMMAINLLVVFLRARPKMHVVLPIFCVTVMALALVAVAPIAPAVDGAPCPASRRASVARAVSCAGLLAATLGIGLVVEVKFSLPLQRQLSLGVTSATESYVDENPGTLVLFAHTQGLLLNEDCLAFESWRMPDNVILSGGYEQYTQVWSPMLERTGMSVDGLYLNLFDADMVVVGSEEQAELMRVYLTEHSGADVTKVMERELGAGSDGTTYGVWAFSPA